MEILNVAVSSCLNALLTLVINNQFVEIKGSVLKRRTFGALQPVMFAVVVTLKDALIKKFSQIYPACTTDLSTFLAMTGSLAAQRASVTGDDQDLMIESREEVERQMERAMSDSDAMPEEQTTEMAVSGFLDEYGGYGGSGGDTYVLGGEKRVTYVLGTSDRYIPFK
ncbi:hypothetical protein BGZ98_009669 [Dissophora globulifera]|nr:hypothetical protein BGZ98_009669 [Dissophora globulifera]